MNRFIRIITHPLRVTVTETTGIDRRTYRHRATTLDDALSWLACYPTGTVGTVRTRSGRIIARRQA
jgi:hypothetical protein